MNAVHKCEGFKLVGFIADSLRLHINLALQSGYLYNQFRLNFFPPTQCFKAGRGLHIIYTQRVCSTKEGILHVYCRVDD